MQELLGRPFIDREASLAPVNRVTWSSLGQDFRRGGEPLLDVPAAAFTLLIFYGADRLAHDEWMMGAGLFCRGLDFFRLDVAHARFGHAVCLPNR